MSQRFFRATPAIYAEVLATLDAAWGFPKCGCQHVFLPLQCAPKRNGMAYLAVQEQDVAMAPADDLLSQLLLSGDVVEVPQAEYQLAMSAADYELPTGPESE